MPRCKKCKKKFDPKYFLQKFCLEKDPCIKAHSEYAKDQFNKQKEKVAKAARKETKKKIEDLEPLRYWVKKCQKYFNTYIRDRDKGKPCISCNKPLVGKYDAGHFYSTGASPELRFNENNVHGQCVFCNQHQHGNIHDYTIELPKRIGLEAFENLKQEKGKVNRYTKTELIELIETYKAKTKALNT